MNLRTSSKFHLLLLQLQSAEKSALDFLHRLPTALLALFLLFLLVYNGFSVFSVYLPLPSPLSPEIKTLPFSPLSPEIKTLPFSPFPKSSLNLTSSVITALKEQNPPQIHSVLISAKASRKARKHKRRLRSLPSESPENNFSERVKDFFAANSCQLKFFMIWISSSDSFGKREFFAIESLFKSNPSACLIIVSNSMDSPKGRKIIHPFQENGYKIFAISPDFNHIFGQTDAEKWFYRLKTGRVKPGEVSLGQNISNLLRLALLYKYGGVYIDTDIIVLKSFSNLRNVIGAQTIDQETRNWSRLNNAVLIFDKNHPLLLKFIEEFTLTFNGNKWGHNGPYLVSRVVSRLNGQPGFNFSVLPPLSFYPVDWSRVRSLFQSPKGEVQSKWLTRKMKQIYSVSFALHLWNRQSKKIETEKGSIVDLVRLNFCLFCNTSISSL